MFTLSAKPVLLLASVLAAGVLTQGCATKKYVNQQVSPVDQRVTELARQSDEQGRSIGELDSKVDTSVSRLDENIRTAQRIAEDATRMAQDAGETANSAVAASKENQTRLASLETKLGSVHNFELNATESVVFGFDRHELNDEAKAKLNDLMTKVKAHPVFVVEVQGYTDKTGTSAYNLALSEKRADAVVRYLTTTYNIPLRNIHKLGVGSEDPVGDNATRDGRKQNRRVEVRVFTPELTAGPMVSSENGKVRTTAASY
jgi:OOP family OmpA-OmpF porin